MQTPPSNAPVFDFDRVVKNASQRLFNFAGGRPGLEGVTMEVAARLVMETLRCHDEEAVRIGIMEPGDMIDLEGLDAPLCDDCVAKTN